jgi:hypothetical protein
MHRPSGHLPQCYSLVRRIVDSSKLGPELVMVSFDVCRTLRTITKATALTVAAAPFATLAQPPSPLAASDPLQTLVAEIGAIQALQGSNSPDLIEPLIALSFLYEEGADYELALAVIEDTTRVIKINRGLHTLDEAQRMRQAIRIERARGNAEAAWDEEQQLLRLIRRRRHQADARVVPFLHEIADYRRAILARYQAGEFPPEIVLGCYYSEWEYDANGTPYRSGCRAGNRLTVIRSLQNEAFGYDSEAEAFIGRLERWIELPCAKPAASPVAVERRPERAAKEDMQAYFRAVSDYAGCTQAKYEHAIILQASAVELAQLASDRTAAAKELTAQAALYNERFGR